MNMVNFGNLITFVSNFHHYGGAKKRTEKENKQNNHKNKGLATDRCISVRGGANE